jgi:hypothetical protein
MDIQLIGDGKLVIYLADEDVKRLPAAPSQMTTSEAAELLRCALGSTYDPSWDSVYFEMYPGRDSLLLFAMQHSGTPSYFTFDSVEELIAAAEACPPGLISYLSYMGDTYVLVVYPWSGEQLPYPLYEYGTEFIRPSAFALHLSEHSGVIAGPAALDELRAAFCGSADR